MCGIAGIVNGDVCCYEQKLNNMLDAIKYRGPDDSGIEIFDGCALGHVRLSIVDLHNGHQPMVAPYTKSCIVFNGEIYGYKDLKKYLRGYHFSTDCDTEVLLAMYDKYGIDMISRLPGMYAFAIWDSAKQMLFCARDRFGEKPFYYAKGRNGEFVFASEIKAILASGLVDPVVDEAQIARFLNYSYIYPTRTIYKNIYTLAPGHQLIYSDGNINIERYWHLPSTNTQISEEEAVEEFRRLFKQAVQRQLVADVPVAAFLSGGLDSGTVVSVASEMVPRLTTISFAFREGIDESANARTMAAKYGTNHLEIRDLDFDIVHLLNKMQNIFDEPFADPAAIPAYLIAKSAREHAKVVLTGDAGDELLGGYESKYGALAYMKAFKNSQYPLIARKTWLKSKLLGERLIRKLKVIAKQDLSKIILEGRNIKDIEIQLSGVNMAMSDIKNIVDYCRSKKMLSNEYNNLLSISEEPVDYLINSGFLKSDDLDNALRVDIQDYLPGNGFVKTDRTTMAVSLESRTPFCDKDLAEFCISLPFTFKMQGKDNKYLLRKAFQDKWTPPVRKGIKNGFAPPFYKWLKSKGVTELIEYYLRDNSRKIYQNGLVSYEGVQSILQVPNMSWPCWSLLQLSMWCEKHPC